MRRCAIGPVTLSQHKPYRFGGLGWHFCQSKDGKWHVVPDGLVGAICNGTPRGATALEVAHPWDVCPKCARDCGFLVGYVRTCVECHEPLSDEQPGNHTRCTTCAFKPNKVGRMVNAGSLGHGGRMTHGRR